jgi:hypothetical protein
MNGLDTVAVSGDIGYWESLCCLDSLPYSAVRDSIGNPTAERF